MSKKNKTTLGELETHINNCHELMLKANNILVKNGENKVEEVKKEPLKVLLLGSYNAGKSTIVNALIGEKKAETGDVPTTKKRHDYDWHGYHIVDLPGLDARELEDDEALKALRDAHVVLYVVSSQTGIDLDKTWFDIRELNKKRIPFIVLINNKQPIQKKKNETELEYKKKELEYKKKIIGNFIKKTLLEIKTDFSGNVHWVRAAAAEKGRIENKESLIQSSGIDSFEADVMRRLMNCDVILRMRTHLSLYDDKLKSLQDKLKSKLKAASTKKIVDLIKECNDAKKKMLAQGQIISQDYFPSLKDQIIGQLGLNANKMTSAEGELEYLIQNVYHDALSAFEGRAKNIMIPLYNEIDKVMKVDGIPKDKLNIKITMPSIDDVDNSKIDAAKKAGKEIIKIILKNLPTDIGKKALTEGTKQAGKVFAKKTLEKLGKEGAKQGGKIAAKIVGPLIEIVDAIDTIRTGLKEAEKEKQQMQAAMRLINGQAGLISARVQNSYSDKCSLFTRLLSAPVESFLKTELQKKSGEDSLISSHIKAVNDLIIDINEESSYIIERVND